VSRIALFLLLAVAPVAWASIEMDAAADYAQQPLDALLRLEFAQSLAVASGYEEEAQIGLSALLDDAAVGSAARASQVTSAITPSVIRAAPATSAPAR